MRKNKMISVANTCPGVLIAALYCLSAAVALSSCMSNGPASRKKMPGYLQSEAFENDYPFNAKKAKSNSFYGFAANESDITVNGQEQPCITIPVPDAAYDAMAVSLFESYKAMAVPLLTEWAKQNRNTVVIDLRSNTTQAGSRSDYALEKSGEFSIPVIFMWDGASETRANSFITLLQGVQGISCRQIKN